MRARAISGARHAAAAIGRGMMLACLAAAMLVVRPADAATAGATVAAAEEAGYARLVFTFDRTAPAFEARIVNGVLVVSFSDPVDVDVAGVARALPGYVTAGRRDPSGGAVRFALGRRVTVNTMQAAEKLFVDLLPETWAGLPPGLPADVVAELARRMRAAEAAEAAAMAAVRPVPPARPLELRAGTHDAVIRLALRFAEAPDTRFSHVGDRVEIEIRNKVVFDAGAARGVLPAGITGLTAQQQDGALALGFDVPPGAEVQSFREDDAVIIDVVPKLPPVDIEIGPGLRGPAAAIASAPMPVPRPVEAAPVPVSLAEAAPLAAVAAPVAEAVPARQPPAVAPAAPPPPLLPRRPSLTTAGETTTVTFPFTSLPAAAAFGGARLVWVVFDDPGPLDLDGLRGQLGGALLDVGSVATDAGVAVSLLLSKPRLVSLSAAGGAWVLSLGDSVKVPAQPVSITADYAEDGRSVARVALKGAAHLHWISEPGSGKRIAVVTAAGPAQGLAQPRDFVDFRALATAHGLAVVPKADDLTLRTVIDEVEIAREAGLVLSVAPGAVPAPSIEPPGGWLFAAPDWREQRERSARDGVQDLMRAAALASPAERPAARLALARFHLVHDDYADARAVLDVVADDTPALLRDRDFMLMRGVALVGLRLFAPALRELGAAGLQNDPEAALWRGLAEAGTGAVATARRSLAEGESVLPRLAPELQQRFRQAAVELSLAARDFAGAAAALERLDALGTRQQMAQRDVLRGRIAEGLGQTGTAIEAYRSALALNDPAANAEARLRSTLLRLGSGGISRGEAVRELESLATGWRGDDLEAESLTALAGLYAEDGRWRDALSALRTAVRYHPNAESTRAAQDKFGAAFVRMFAGDGADAAPPTLESVALFYDFKELTPPGRVGDEMIRRLADRLVEADLLEPASELLEYQVENRLTGLARAQVATRAALVHLLNRKPRRAYAVLQETRLAGVPAEIARARRMLEARALAETGRAAAAVELIEGLDGDDVEVLRGDILWNAHRWQEAAETLERIVGQSWQGREPLTDAARVNVLRAAISYALAGDTLGLDRLRTKFAPKMSASPDARAFDVVTRPLSGRGPGFQAVARSVSGADTMRGFLDEYRRRYPHDAVPTPVPNVAGPARASAENGTSGQQG